MSRKRKQIADIIDNFVGGLVMSEKKWRENIRKVVPYVPEIGRASCRERV